MIEPQPAGEDPVLVQLQRSVASLFTVERLLGRGRMTAVYKAAGLNPPRPVALKVLPPGLGVAFRDEARKAMALNHPNIVPIYSVGLRAGAPYFVAMKLVEGRGLDAVIESQGALPLPAIIVVLRATTEALNYAHGRGTIHGHLTAANILLDPTGRAMVSDFGIARAIEDAALPAAGKPRFLSPEQAAGGVVGPPSDQYTLGIVALQMLTGSAPVDPDSLRTSLRDVSSGRDGLPDGLVHVVETALAQDPAQRYASMTDMLAAIKAIPFSDADRREGYTALGQLARGEPVPKVRVPSRSPGGDSATASRAAAPKAVSVPAPAVPAARPTPAPPAVKAVPAPPAAKAVPAPPAVKAVPAPPTAKPVPAPPAVKAVPAPPTAKAVPAPPAVKAVPATPRVSAAIPAPAAPAVKAVPATPRASAEIAVPATPRVSAAIPAPAPPAVEAVPATPRASAEIAVPATPTEHVVLVAPAEPAPKRHLRMVWVLAALLVTAGLAVTAYLVLGRRPAASPMAQAPIASQGPSVPAPSAVPAVPAVAESSRSDTARRVSAAADTALAPETTGLLLLTAVPATAEILVDGRASGNNGFVDSEVTAGRRRLRISAPGYVTLDTLIRVSAGGTVDLGRVSLRESAAEGAAPAPQATGRLRLRAVPPTAEIFVDGQSVGVGSLVDFEVAAGQRQLRISAPGYLTLDTLITVDAGATVRLGQISLKSGPGGP